MATTVAWEPVKPTNFDHILEWKQSKQAFPVKFWIQNIHPMAKKKIKNTEASFLLKDRIKRNKNSKNLSSFYGRSTQINFVFWQ